MRKHLSRRLRLVAAGLATALLASACGSGAETDNNNIELSFYWWGNDSRHAYTQKLIDTFQAKHTNIKIKPTFTDFGGYWDALATATAGGNAPDIMQMEERYVREYQGNNLLLDLGTVADTLKTADIDPSVMEAGKIDGGLYTIATGVNAFVVMADPQVVKDAGKEMPDADKWTWEDYLSLTSEIAKAGKDKFYGAQAFGGNEALFNIYARQRGEALYNADGSLGFKPETLAAFWQMALDQIKSGATPSAEETVEIADQGLEQQLLGTHKAAFNLDNWTNQFGAIAKASGRELQLLRVPGESAGKPGMYFKPAMSWSISSKSKHPKEAAMFLDFLLNTNEAGDVLLTDRGLPANLKVREHVASLLQGPDKQVAEFMAKLQPQLGDPPPAPPQGAGATVDIMVRLQQEVLFGRMSPIDAANKFIEEVTAATKKS